MPSERAKWAVSDILVTAKKLVEAYYRNNNWYIGLQPQITNLELAIKSLDNSEYADLEAYVEYVQGFIGIPVYPTHVCPMILTFPEWKKERTK